MMYVAKTMGLKHSILMLAKIPRYSCIRSIGQRGSVKHVKNALTANGYTKWVVEIPKKKKKAEDPSKDRATARKAPVSIPYILCVSEQLQIP